MSFDVSKHQYYIFDLHRQLQIDLLTVKAVYLRRPEVVVHTKYLSTGENNLVKSEITYSLEALYKILEKAFWINSVDDIRKAENKIYQLLLAKELGLNIPNSILTNAPESAMAFYKTNRRDCMIKPVKSGLISGDVEEGVIFTNKLELDDNNVARVAQCPVYIQNLIHKTADVRVTVVGRKIFGALIHSQDGTESMIDWRRATHPLKHSVLDIPDDIIQKCLNLAQKLKLNFGAIDFVLDKEKQFVFLEINPNGQWAWIERQLNFKISHEITSLLVENSQL